MMQERCATLWRPGTKENNVGSCWLKGFTGLKLCATTPNNMQQHATGQDCALAVPGGPWCLNYATYTGHPGLRPCQGKFQQATWPKKRQHVK